MSISYSTYIGPFFRCKFHTESSPVVGKTCPTAGCANRGTSISSDYCPKCGGKAKSGQVGETKRPSVLSLYHLMPEDSLVLLNGEDPKNDEHLLIPNRNILGRETTIDRGDLGIFLSIDDIDPMSETKRMAEEYEIELEILDKAYDKVKIGWGVISAAN